MSAEFVRKVWFCRFFVGFRFRVSLSRFAYDLHDCLEIEDLFVGCGVCGVWSLGFRGRCTGHLHHSFSPAGVLKLSAISGIALWKIMKRQSANWYFTLHPHGSMLAMCRVLRSYYSVLCYIKKPSGILFLDLNSRSGFYMTF